jgi:hypothetical protein
LFWRGHERGRSRLHYLFSLFLEDSPDFFELSLELSFELSLELSFELSFELSDFDELSDFEESSDFDLFSLLEAESPFEEDEAEPVEDFLA